MDKLFSVQPMNIPSSDLSYLDYKYSYGHTQEEIEQLKNKIIEECNYYSQSQIRNSILLNHIIRFKDNIISTNPVGAANLNNIKYVFSTSQKYLPEELYENIEMEINSFEK